MMKRISYGSMAILGVAFGFLMLFSSTSNAATYWTGSSGGGGSGNCSFSSAWKFTSSWPSAVSQSHGCNNTLMNNGKANPCTNKGGVIGVWFLYDKNSPYASWIQWYEGGNDSKATWAAFVRGTNGSVTQAEAEYVVDNNSGDKTLLWLCKDNPQSKDYCKDLTRPEPSGRLADYYGSRKGSTIIPGSIDEVADQKEWCFLNCPVYNAKSPNSSYKKWTIPSRAEKFVPALASDGTNMTNAERGAYCASRPNETTDRTAAAIRSTSGGSNDDNGAGYQVVAAHPYFKSTRVNWGTEAIAGGVVPNWDYLNENGSALAAESNKTPFGALMDGYAPSAWGTKDNGPSQSQIDSAVAATNTLNPSNVALGNVNKEVMGRGGVLTTVGSVRYYTANERRTKMFVCTYQEVDSWSFSMTNTEDMTMNAPVRTDNASSRCSTSALPGSITAANRNTNNYGNWTGVDIDVDVYAIAGTDEVRAAWQALANHCNAPAYNAASPANAANGVAITKINNNDATKQWSGSSVTASITSNPLNNLVWGNVGHVSTQENTQWKGFFDKECAFNGVRTEESEAVTKHPRNNVYAKNATKVDLFVPRSEGVVKYNNTPAVSTTVTRWADGTPYPANSPKAIKGQFNMAIDPSGAPDTRFFDGANTEPAGQKNWSVDEFKTAKAGLVAGQANTFYVASNWASEQDAPQVLTVKYEYAPVVENTIPTVLGFDANFGREYTASVVGVPVQGKLYANPGQSTSPANNSSFNLFQMQEAQTGTKYGTSETHISDLDKNDLPFGGNGKLRTITRDGAPAQVWTASPREASSYYRVIQFVRTVSE